MGSLLKFCMAERARRPGKSRPPENGATIIAFPGADAERQAVDLAARIRKVATETGGTAQPEA